MRTARAARTAAALLTAVLAVTVAGCGTGHDAVDTSAGGNRYVPGDGRTVSYPVAQRRSAPALTGTTLDGTGYDLAAARGRVVVLNFWASWCAPCVAESADLDAVYRASHASGVDFLGVNTRDQHDAAVAFAGARLAYPSLFDPAGRIALRFNDVNVTLPSTLIVDRSGRIAVVIHDGITTATLTPLVDRIAAEP